MPNIKSAKKRTRVIEKKTARNRSAKSALKTQLKKFDEAVADGTREEAQHEYTLSVKALDKAAAKGLIHSNKAARKKSQLTLRLNALAAE